MAETARLLELPIVTGDTKVANTGDPENLFINTTGIGAVHPRTYLNASRLEAGDAIIHYRHHCRSWCRHSGRPAGPGC